MTVPTHAPVMCDRVVSLLAPALQQPGSILVDATVGLGGHSGALLRTCPQARVVGIIAPGTLQDTASGQFGVGQHWQRVGGWRAFYGVGIRTDGGH